MPGRIGGIVTAALVFAMAGAGDAHACAFANSRAGAVADEQLERATVCLLNAERAEARLPPLRPVGSLATAAAGHARDMVVRRFFAHTSRDGRDLLLRVKGAGYLKGTAGFTVGENLAWGKGRLSTPRSIVAGWMRSPPHRANVLRPEFRDVGIGVSRGAPVGGRGGTYVADFGARLGR